MSFYRPSASLFSLDTRHPDQSWKRRTSMRNIRSLPATVADTDPKQWAEVFDTKSGQWGFLPPPPELPSFDGLFAVPIPSLNSKVLVGSHDEGFLYTYVVKEGRWERWENSIIAPVPLSRSTRAAVGTGLFRFHEGTLHVYDFSGQWYSHSSPIKDLDKVVLPAILAWRFDGLLHPVLLHVAGNVFCLLCLEYLPVKQYHLLHCIKLCVSDIVDEGGKLVPFHAAVMSSENYAIETPVRIIDAGLM